MFNIRYKCIALWYYTAYLENMIHRRTSEQYAWISNWQIYILVECRFKRYTRVILAWPIVNPNSTEPKTICSEIVYHINNVLYCSFYLSLYDFNIDCLVLFFLFWGTINLGCLDIYTFRQYILVYHFWSCALSTECQCDIFVLFFDIVYIMIKIKMIKKMLTTVPTFFTFLSGMPVYFAHTLLSIWSNSMRLTYKWEL